jgi:hypothetical protein
MIDSSKLASVLIEQSRTTQGYKLSQTHAAELAAVVAPLIDAVGEAIAGHPYDVDATSFFAVLQEYAELDAADTDRSITR